jgi:hypothetical protein
MIACARIPRLSASRKAAFTADSPVRRDACAAPFMLRFDTFLLPGFSGAAEKSCYSPVRLPAAIARRIVSNERSYFRNADASILSKIKAGAGCAPRRVCVLFD